MSGVSHPPGPRAVIIGANVKRQRARRKMTQEALAAECGMTQQIIAKLELGNTNMRAEQLLDIAAALRVKPALLLRGVEELDRAGKRRK